MTVVSTKKSISNREAGSLNILASWRNDFFCNYRKEDVLCRTQMSDYEVRGRQREENNASVAEVWCVEKGDELLSSQRFPLCRMFEQRATRQLRHGRKLGDRELE